MAKLEAGIFSRPSGNNNGLVFGAGRTLQGKKTTIRQKVTPANPRTNAQMNQRSKFSASLQIVRQIGRAIYQFDWNRAVGELAGFHSLQSRFLDNINEDGTEVEVPFETTLGIRHFPDELEASFDGPDIRIEWSTELGDIGAEDDHAVIIAIEQSDEGPDWDRRVDVDTLVNRNAGMHIVGAINPFPSPAVIGIYFRTEESSTPEDQRRSLCRFIEVAPGP